jgi:hypothetical protein
MRRTGRVDLVASGDRNTGGDAEPSARALLQRAAPGVASGTGTAAGAATSASRAATVHRSGSVGGAARSDDRCACGKNGHEVRAIRHHGVADLHSTPHSTSPPERVRSIILRANRLRLRAPPRTPAVKQAGRGPWRGGTSGRAARAARDAGATSKRSTARRPSGFRVDPLDPARQGFAGYVVRYRVGVAHLRRGERQCQMPQDAIDDILATDDGPRGQARTAARAAQDVDIEPNCTSLRSTVRSTRTAEGGRIEPNCTSLRSTVRSTRTAEGGRSEAMPKQVCPGNVGRVGSPRRLVRSVGRRSDLGRGGQQRWVLLTRARTRGPTFPGDEDSIAASMSNEAVSSYPPAEPEA